MDQTCQIDEKEIKGIDPLLQVFDMPSSLRFYRDKLGFVVADSSGVGDDVDWVMLTLNKIILMLNTEYEKQNRPANPDQNRIKAHADTSLYFGYPDIDALYRYYVARGITLKKPTITGYGWKALYVEDPDGYILCFHWPEKKK
jgi:glyoxylase I family protein